MLISLMSINYFGIGNGLSMFPTLLVMMLFAIYILLKNGKIKDLGMLFFVNGSVSCFLTWMNFTPVTLGFPLLIYYLLNINEDKKFSKFVYVSVIYLISFSITWIVKWLITDIVCNTKILEDAFKQVLFRISNYDPDVGRNVTFGETVIFNCYYRIIFLIPEIFLMIFIVLSKLKKINKNFIKEFFSKNYIFIIIGLIPFIIYFITTNHSSIHAGLFTNKILMLTECAMMILTYKFYYNVNEMDLNKKPIKPLDKN